MLKTQKSNICYVLFLMIVIPLILLFLFAPQKRTKENLTSKDYNRAFEIGSYNFKVSNVVRSSDCSKLSFYYKVAERITPTRNSKPEIVSVVFYDKKNNAIEKKFTVKKIKFDEFKVTVDNAENKFMYVKINITSQENSYTEPDTVDQFGDVVKGTYHQGKPLDYYINVDVQDISDLSSEEFEKYTPPIITTTTVTTSSTEIISDMKVNSTTKVTADKTTTVSTSKYR